MRDEHIHVAAQMMGEPCYDALRTKQQLGYSVHSGTRLTHGVLGFCVVVASGIMVADCQPATHVDHLGVDWQRHGDQFSA